MVLWRIGAAWIAEMDLSVFLAAVSARPAVVVAAAAEHTKELRSAGLEAVAIGSHMTVAAVCIHRTLHP
jgi:hypothetical protein